MARHADKSTDGAPTIQRSQTGEGYVYFRDRAGDGDRTIYEHQLVALLDHDPADVFNPSTEVHHETAIPWLNARSNLTVVDADHHRRDLHGWGGPPIAATDGGEHGET
jgi:hypothetical protein